MAPIPSPVILSSYGDNDRGETEIQSRPRAIKNTQERGDNPMETDNNAVNLHLNNDEPASGEVRDDGQSESPQSNPNVNNTSPASSTISTKENKAPKKTGKSKAKSNMIMTYSPKRRKRSSSTNTTTPPKRNKRGRPSSSRSSKGLPSAKKEVIEESISFNDDKDGGDNVSCTGSTASDQRSTSSSTLRGSRRSSRVVRGNGIEQVAPSIMSEKSVKIEQDTNEDLGFGSNEACKTQYFGDGEGSGPTRSITIDMNDISIDPDEKAAVETVDDDTEKMMNPPEDDLKNEIKSDMSDSDDDSSDEERTKEGVYVVERIDDKRVIEGITYYFIKWKGWPESSNTWEPLGNLDGCSKLLKSFEERYAEKKTRRRTAAAKTKRKDSYNEDDELNAMEEAQSHMRSYGILTAWPADKEPLSVDGVISVDGVLTYVVKRKVRLGSNTLDRSNAILVHADGFRELYPELVIKFYESRVIWTANVKCDKEQANVAAQIALLNQNNGSQLGRVIANDLDSKLREKYIAVKQVDDVKHLELDTQVIGDGDPVTVEDDVMEVDDTQVNEDDGARDKDAFGLPKDMEDSEDTSSASSVSDSDMEDIDCVNKQPKNNAVVEEDESDIGCMDKY